MIDWLCRGRFRLALILAAYFGLHIVVRILLSPSLDYDESEQAFLSQWISIGYNSQPPLYTWLQRCLFQTIGWSVLSLVLLKCCFLLLTYCFVFAGVAKATGDRRLAVVASLGMLSIPQIAWESHRDLSHTVAATCATAFLFYAIVGLVQQRRPERNLVWYVLLGVAVGIGMLFKYNFAIVVFGFVGAALSLRQYRDHVLDWRILISISIAAMMLLPHSIWMLGHRTLVSAKTVSTMTTNQSSVWIENVASGFSALGISTASCCAITVILFTVLFMRRVTATDEEADLVEACRSTSRFIERFLIIVALVLVVLVISGTASEFKNRWLQPFVCLLPAYLILKFGLGATRSRGSLNAAVYLSLAMMVCVISAVVARPILAQQRGKFCWLNVPYGQVVEAIEDSGAPKIVVTSNMRLAGNLRLHYPTTSVLAEEAEHMGVRRGAMPAIGHALLLTDETSTVAQESLVDFACRSLQIDQPANGSWQPIDVPYLYGSVNDKKQFYFRTIELAPEGHQPRIAGANPLKMTR